MNHCRRCREYSIMILNSWYDVEFTTLCIQNIMKKNGGNIRTWQSGWEISARQWKWKFGWASEKQAWASGILYRLYKRLPSLGKYQNILVSEPDSASHLLGIKLSWDQNKTEYVTVESTRLTQCYGYKSAAVAMSRLHLSLTQDLRDHCGWYFSFYGK